MRTACRVNGVRMTDTRKSQEAVFALLADPATHGGANVKRVDTHAAVVFLAPERAIKVKRAVKFPFLDYSTLNKRKAACEAELRVNRPFAPDIYRGVFPITREADGRLALDGRGEPVEWAVEMRRFDESQTLDHLADRGRIDATLADALGRTVAEAHAHAPADAARWIAALGAYVDEHAEAFRARPEVFAAERVRALTRDGRAAYARVRPLLETRGQQGFIRRIHGDLHLGNIVLLDNRPVLFDAIEFSDIIGSGDVMYDLAFLLMDLCERNLGEAANIVLNRYLTVAKADEKSRCTGGAALLSVDARRDPRQGYGGAARPDQGRRVSPVRSSCEQVFRLGLPPHHSRSARAGRGRRPVRHR